MLVFTSDSLLLGSSVQSHTIVLPSSSIGSISNPLPHPLLPSLPPTTTHPNDPFPSTVSNPLPHPLPSLPSSPHSNDPFPSTSVQLLSLPSNSGFWPHDLVVYSCNFKLSAQDFERQVQIKAIQNLLQKYGRDRVQNHQFEWITYSSGSVADEWLPMYTYKMGISIWDIWEEWTNGLDGHLSVRQLNDGWDARWRRNKSGQKTEVGRRKKVVELVEALAKKPNWSIPLALRFLKEKYPIPSSSQPYLKSTRAFIEHLQNKTTGKMAFQAILLQSSSYCSS